MTEKQKNTEQALTELQEWMQTLQKQSKDKGLNDSEIKLLFTVRDLAIGKKPETTPAPAAASAPKPPFDYMQASARDLFERLDLIVDLFTPDHRHGYNQLRTMFENDGHTGVSLPWEGIDLLRKIYGTYCFKRR